MRVVLQRVSGAKVKIDDEITGSIGIGFLLLLGIEENDEKEDVQWLVKKISSMRVFSDEGGLMNLSLKDVDGQVLIISQFTLHASTKKGNRPSFIKAAKPDKAIPLYEYFIEEMQQVCDKPVQAGVFGAYMQIDLINDGPVTIIIDSKNKE